VSIWREGGDSDDILFLFDVDDLQNAKRFVSHLEAGEVGGRGGVIEGELHFLSVSNSY